MANLLQRPAGRKVVFAALYCAEGAPIGFIWWALPTILRESGAEVDRIGTLLSLLVLPWALKFLWAPMVDVLRGRRWGLRAWIVGSQLLMAASLVPLLWSSAMSSFGWLAAALVVHAFAAATQDVAIDNLAIQSTTPEERGGINGWMQAGMLVGRSAFGGGVLVLRRWTGDRSVLLTLIGLLLVSLVLVFLIVDPSIEHDRHRTRERLREFGAHVVRAARSGTTWLALLFAASGGAGFEAVGGLAGPFLIDLGLDSTDVGAFFTLPGVACMALGALAGGFAADRMGRRVAVTLFALFLNGTILAFACAPFWLGEITPTAAFGLLGLVYLGIGLFTASSYALFMDLTDPALGSTQFSAYMGATNLCEAWSVYAAGHFVAARGYGTAFVLLALVSVLALGLLVSVRPGASAAPPGS